MWQRYLNQTHETISIFDSRKWGKRGELITAFHVCRCCPEMTWSFKKKGLLILHFLLKAMPPHQLQGIRRSSQSQKCHQCLKFLVLFLKSQCILSSESVRAWFFVLVIFLYDPSQVILPFNSCFKKKKKYRYLEANKMSVKAQPVLLL